MKSHVTFPGILAIVIVAVSCGPPTDRNPASSSPVAGSQPPAGNSTSAAPLVVGGAIAPEAVHARIAAGETIVILDVRTPAENAESRIPGSILIPHDQVAAEAVTRLPDRNAFIAVYCRSGRRSGLAIQELMALGYTRVYNMGGIGDWPYATEP